ncbi:Alpha/Beta hydrolase protein [Myxozyma melibiosi]|uniref:Palmitoyl-protein thioesterase 1 n=1 Tax=Myxozyma melibiosi TaxID=54550 RepID=A0ABR1F706_9ASCO
MVHLGAVLLALGCLLATAAAESAVRPVVMWHGLGDDYKSGGMQRVESLIKDMYPGIFVHSVYLDEDPEKDSKASLFGSLNEQIQFVCDQLASIPELANGFDGLGFSQGGLFLRGYVERCNAPKVHNLLTFGSPQNGVEDMPPCENPRDFVCRRRNAVLKTQAYAAYAQNSVTVAQYYRDLDRYDKYLEFSAYLADVNNERSTKNITYADNIKSLENLVLYLFTEDQTVVPKESAWFGQTDKSNGAQMSLEDRALFQEDWIGLKSLYQDGKLKREILEGRHMNITNATVLDFAAKYLGSSGQFEPMVAMSAPDAVQEAMVRFGQSFHDRLQVVLSAMAGMAYM